MIIHLLIYHALLRKERDGCSCSRDMTCMHACLNYQNLAEFATKCCERGQLPLLLLCFATSTCSTDTKGAVAMRDGSRM